MKKIAVIMAIVAIAGLSSANLVGNGDFEAGNDGAWSQWWGGNSEVGAPDPIDGDLCGGTWWSDDGIFQGFAIGAGMYTVSGELLNHSADALGKNRIAVIRAEIGELDINGNFVFWWNQDIQIDQNAPLDVWQSGSTVIDNTTAGASYMNINLFMIDLDGPHTGEGNARYDNINVIPEPATLGLLGLAGAGLYIRRKLLS